MCVCVHMWLEGLVCGELIAWALIMWPVAVMECDSSVLCSGSPSFQPAKPIRHTLPCSPTASPCIALHHSLRPYCFQPPHAFASTIILRSSSLPCPSPLYLRHYMPPFVADRKEIGSYKQEMTFEVGELGYFSEDDPTILSSKIRIKSKQNLPSL